LAETQFPAPVFRPLDALLVGVIDFYQTRLSPLKGFRCAHRARHGGPSCSQVVKNAIRRGGVMAGWTALKRRAAACRRAFLALKADTNGTNDETASNEIPKKRGGELCFDTGLEFGVQGGCDCCLGALFD